jgi:hypothetical protein
MNRTPMPNGANPGGLPQNIGSILTPHPRWELLVAGLVLFVVAAIMRSVLNRKMRARMASDSWKAASRSSRFPAILADRLARLLGAAIFILAAFLVAGAFVSDGLLRPSVAFLNGLLSHVGVRL